MDPRSPGPVVRPYAITRGRSGPAPEDLEIEALVVTLPYTEVSPNLSFECRAVARLCRQVQSIAEISALLKLPLGVTRTLVDDMAAEGLLRIHRPNLAADSSQVTLLERILDGLRKL